MPVPTSVSNRTRPSRWSCTPVSKTSCVCPTGRYSSRPLKQLMRFAATVRERSLTVAAKPTSERPETARRSEETMERARGGRGFFSVSPALVLSVCGSLVLAGCGSERTALAADQPPARLVSDTTETQRMQKAEGEPSHPPLQQASLESKKPVPPELDNSQLAVKIRA